MKNATYIAYAVLHYESSCGCYATKHYNVYDYTGNNLKRFTDYQEAKNAAIAKMLEFNADDWKVI